ncbi:MAG: putative RNA uridine N3 methyltransferase, partial [Sulfolobaceae archaeon]
MFPYPRSKSFDVILFPAIFNVENTLREITIKTSFLVRILTNARVTNLYWVLQSKNDEKVIKVVNSIIKYALTPPYLKKYIKLNKNLKYVGLLDPVNTPYHVVSKDLIEGELRMGIRKNDFIDIGTNFPIKIKNGKFF